MKLLSTHRPARNGFTLNEIMVAMALLTMVLGGVVASHLFGMRMLEITRAKLGANDETRRALNSIVEEIRSARIVRIGEGDNRFFTEAALNTRQEGSALQIYPTLDTNIFIRYYHDPEAHQLRRITHDAWEHSIVASAVTNRNIFSAEDYLGNVLTNNQNNRVIALTLQFYQLQHAGPQVGPGNYYEFYQVRTKITRRALE